VDKSSLTDILGFPQGKLPLNYLGLPLSANYLRSRLYPSY